MNLSLEWFHSPHSINRVTIHIQSFYEINVSKNCFYEYRWTFCKHQMWINLITNNFQPVRRIDYNLYENNSSSRVAFFLGQNNTVCHYRNNCYYKIQFLIMVLHGSFRRIGVIFNRLNRSCTLDIRIINNQLRDFRRYTFANIR